MQKPEKIALIGLGAIGAAYAAKIYDQYPQSIKIIADAVRAGQIEKGITVNNKLYRFACVSPPGRERTGGPGFGGRQISPAGASDCGHAKSGGA